MPIEVSFSSATASVDVQLGSVSLAVSMQSSAVIELALTAPGPAGPTGPAAEQGAGEPYTIERDDDGRIAAIIYDNGDRKEFSYLAGQLQAIEYTYDSITTRKTFLRDDDGAIIGAEVEAV